MFELLVIAAFIIPTLLSISLGWFFIRRGHATVGICAGLSLITAIPVVAVALVKVLPYDEGAIYLVVIMVLEAFGSAVIFLLVGAVLLGHYRGRWAPSSILLVAPSLLVSLCSIIGLIDSQQYTDATKFYISLFGGILGIGLFLLAIRAARKSKEVKLPLS